MEIKMDEDIRIKLAGILSVIFEKDVKSTDNISMDTEENWTSLKHIELVVMLEEEFEVSFNSEIIPYLTSQEKILFELESLLK